MIRQTLIGTALVTCFCLIGLVSLTGADGNWPLITQIVSGMYNEKIYDEINKYLEEELKGDERVEKNMDKAIEWLNSKVSSGNCLSPKSYQSALKELKALKNGIQCDQSGYRLLKSIERASKYKVHRRPSHMKSERRIDKIIHHYFMEHARRCHRVYVERFRLKFNQSTNKPKLQNVLDLTLGKVYGTANYIRNQATKNIWTKCDLERLRESFDLYYHGVGHSLTSEFMDGPKLRDALRFLARNDLDANYTNYSEDNSSFYRAVQRKKVKSLSKSYIVEPCNYYTAELGPDLFKPAMYDQEMLSDEEFLRAKYQVLADLDYYIGRTGFMICNRIFEKKSSLTKELIESIQSAE